MIEGEHGEDDERQQREVGQKPVGELAAISLYLFPALMIVVWAQLRFVRKQAY